MKNTRRLPAGDINLPRESQLTKLNVKQTCPVWGTVKNNWNPYAIWLLFIRILAKFGRVWWRRCATNANNDDECLLFPIVTYEAYSLPLFTAQYSTIIQLSFFCLSAKTLTPILRVITSTKDDRAAIQSLSFDRIASLDHSIFCLFRDERNRLPSFPFFFKFGFDVASAARWNYEGILGRVSSRRLDSIKWVTNFSVSYSGCF